jgi:hypothetical protein
MVDRSWMYQDSLQEFQRMDYCKGVQRFINYATSIPINISGDGIRCPCKRCKNKKLFHLDVIMMHFLHKGFIEDTCVSMCTENHLFLTRSW